MHEISPHALVIKSAEFVKSAFQANHYPEENTGEIAFAGRSNVGKSSLINSLVQRKKLVRTSNTPGQTQSINFFIINGVFYFVDLPGYGFAKVPETIRARWKPMVEDYLLERKALRGVVQIMDIRRPPTPEDLQLWQWLLSRGIPTIPVLTKADKIKKGQVEAQQSLAALSLGASPDQLIVFSAVTKQGREKILEKIFSLLCAEANPS